MGVCQLWEGMNAAASGSSQGACSMQQLQGESSFLGMKAEGQGTDIGSDAGIGLRAAL